MPRILIVDDEQQNRDALRLALSDANPDWTILTAESDTEGKAILQEGMTNRTPIDVVLTDLVMANEQSGMSMLEEARRVDPLIMAILFTAKEKSLDRYRAFDFGAFDVVEKNIRGTTAVREIIIKTRAALRYREWSQQINFLRRYFDPKVFELITNDPSILTLHERTVTVAFWDIRGFSQLCETLKAHPTLIADFLREYCEAAAHTIFKNNGLLDKFIGDGVMALFGVLEEVPGDDSDGVLSAIQAARDLRNEFERISMKWGEEWSLYTPQKITIGLGAGIHTGSVLVGNVGTDFRDQFTALGPHVNFAARIEARSQAGQVLLSQSSYARVRNHVTAVSAGEISDVKNIPGTFALHALE